jgi:hypothetical protein
MVSSAGSFQVSSVKRNVVGAADSFSFGNVCDWLCEKQGVETRNEAQTAASCRLKDS